MISQFYYNSGQFGDYSLEKLVVYVDLGDYFEQEIERKHELRRRNFKSNDLSTKGELRLRQAIGKRKSIIKKPIGGEGPALGTIMRSTIDSSKTPIKVKVRKYHAEQRKSLKEYIDKLVKIGFSKICLQEIWQESPHLSPKVSKIKYGTTIALCPVNGATIVHPIKLLSSGSIIDITYADD